MVRRGQLLLIIKNLKPSAEGGWYLPFGVTIPYKPGSWSDRTVEAFGGPHDCWVVKFLVGMTSREIPAVIAHGKKMQDPQ
jgi:hypothetical protein